MGFFKIRLIFFIIYTLSNIFVISIYQLDSREILLREDFNNLDDWEQLYFPKIKRHTNYKIVTSGSENYLKAESSASASGLVYGKRFNIYEFPNIRWRWKVNNIYKNGYAKTKKGDDYPIRVYIIFEYDSKKARFSEKVKYESARIIYGKYPPYSSLNYIWANKEHKEKVITSPYTEKSKMILLQKGITNVGKWQIEEVDIIKDYKEVFGEKPPSIASIAIMNDSDNTGENSISYIDYIEIYKK